MVEFFVVTESQQIESSCFDLKVGDIIVCSHYPGYHRIERFHRTKRRNAFSLVEFRNWNSSTNQFSLHLRNASISTCSLAKTEIEKEIAGLQVLLYLCETP